MKTARMILIAAVVALFVSQAFATDTAFMGFDIGQQKMYTVVMGDAPIHAQVIYHQSNDYGYIGNENSLHPQECVVWNEAELSPIDPDRDFNLPDGAENRITAEIRVFNANDEYLYTTWVNDTLTANVEGGDGFYSYTNNGGCEWVVPDTIRINSHFCAHICHGGRSIPVVCEDPNYNYELLEITVSNGCSPDETECEDASCPRVDWSLFNWYKRILPGSTCRIFLTMSYCGYNPGCVCIWRSDFYLPVNMLGFSASAGLNSVNVRWATASETGNGRFIVTRSDTRDGVYHFVHSEDARGGASGHEYSWTDSEVQAGHTYYYKLHVTDDNGNHVYNQDGQTVIVSATPNGDAGIPTVYSLGNYPNPFNSQTTFTYSLPFDGNVSLKVFDLLGRNVATVVDKHQTAGSYSINWSANGLPSGVYMYTLTSGSFTQTRKLLFVK